MQKRLLWMMETFGNFSLRCLGFNLVKNEIIEGLVWWRRWRILSGGLPQMFLRNLRFDFG